MEWNRPSHSGRTCRVTVFAGIYTARELDPSFNFWLKAVSTAIWSCCVREEVFTIKNKNKLHIVVCTMTTADILPEVRTLEEAYMLEANKSASDMYPNPRARSAEAKHKKKKSIHATKKGGNTYFKNNYEYTGVIASKLKDGVCATHIISTESYPAPER